MFKQPQAELPVLTDKRCLMLPLVHQYKHLGGILSHKGTLSTEIATRFAKARQSYWRAAKAIFRPRHVADKIKAQLFQALVLSVYTWGIGAGPALSKADAWQYQVSYWNLQRLRAARDGCKASQESLCRRFACPYPDDLLQAARARHFATMIKHAPDPVWAVTHLDGPTQQAYLEAIEWVHMALQRERGFQGRSPQQVCQDLSMTSPNAWKSAVKRAAERWRLFRLREQKVTQAHKAVFQSLRRHKACENKSATIMWKHFCLLRRKGFDKKNARFLHANTVHAYKTMEGEATTGSWHNVLVLRQAVPHDRSIEEPPPLQQGLLHFFLEKP